MSDFFGLLFLIIFWIILYKKFLKPMAEEENTYRNLMIEKTQLEIIKLTNEIYGGLEDE